MAAGAPQLSPGGRRQTQGPPAAAARRRPRTGLGNARADCEPRRPRARDDQVHFRHAGRVNCLDGHVRGPRRLRPDVVAHSGASKSLFERGRRVGGRPARRRPQAMRRRPHKASSDPGAAERRPGRPLLEGATLHRSEGWAAEGLVYGSLFQPLINWRHDAGRRGTAGGGERS